MTLRRSASRGAVASSDLGFFYVFAFVERTLSSVSSGVEILNPDRREERVEQPFASPLPGLGVRAGLRSEDQFV